MNLLTAGIAWTDRNPALMLAGMAASAWVGAYLLKVIA
jgi:hypothetical protein